MAQMLCGNTAALRAHELAEERQERLQERAEYWAKREAIEIMTDAKRLAEFVGDYEPDIWHDLARLLDPTTTGERVEHYRRQLRQVLTDAIEPTVIDSCMDTAIEESYGPCD